MYALQPEELHQGVTFAQVLDGQPLTATIADRVMSSRDVQDNLLVLLQQINQRLSYEVDLAAAISVLILRIMGSQSVPAAGVPSNVPVFCQHVALVCSSSLARRHNARLDLLRAARELPALLVRPDVGHALPVQVRGWLSDQDGWGRPDDGGTPPPWAPVPPGPPETSAQGDPTELACDFEAFFEWSIADNAELITVHVPASSDYHDADTSRTLQLILAALRAEDSRHKGPTSAFALSDVQRSAHRDALWAVWIKPRSANPPWSFMDEGSGPAVQLRGQKNPTHSEVDAVSILTDRIMGALEEVVGDAPFASNRLASWALDCVVVPPSPSPRKPGRSYFLWRVATTRVRARQWSSQWDLAQNAATATTDEGDGNCSRSVG